MATLSFNTTRMQTPSLPRISRSSSFTKPIKTHLSSSSQTLSKRRRFVSRSLPESFTKEETLVIKQEEVTEDDDPTSELSYLDPETDAESIKEWELDFCSRPILDSRGKKIWELVVCDASLSLQVTKYFPNNVINSITLKDAIVAITEDLGVPLPEKIRFFRSQMQTIITKACKELAIKEVPSKRCLSLFLWLQERYDTVYTRHPGFQKGSLPLLSLDNPFPMNLPENLFGEKWAFVQLPYSAHNLNSQPQTQSSQLFFSSFPWKTQKKEQSRSSLSRKKKRNMCSKMAFTLTIPRFHSPVSRKPTTTCSSPPSRTQSAHFSHGRSISLRRRLFLLPVKATTDQSGQVGGEEVDSKILPYCSINKNEKRSIGEMEQEFLQAMQSFYYEGKAVMSNEEFDNLKEELMWEGSSVVMLSSDEQRFLEASMAYVSGNPIMSDEEYDKLKMKLKMDGSEIVCEGPRCSLRSKKVYSDLAVDYFKMFLLNVPATVVALGLFFFLDDLTGFEITYLLELPEPFSFIFTWFAAVPAIVYLALSLTKLIIRDSLILKGPCPNCGTENTSFFGTILSISNEGSTNNVKCSGCGTAMVYDSSTRLITLPEGGNA